LASIAGFTAGGVDKLVDVIRLKAIEDKQAETLRDLAGMDEVNYQPTPKL
jgi:hypothetical protein